MAIVPSTRLVTWLNNVGVSGGIPTGQTIYTTLSPTGGSDLVQIQTALNAAPSNQVVKLSVGTFIVGGTLDWSLVGSGVVLRGTMSGTTKQTTVNVTGGAQFYMRGSFYGNIDQVGGTRSALSSDASKGTTTIVLSDASWVTIGDTMIISQLDDTSFVDRKDESNNDASSYQYAGNRGLGQMVKVTNKVSNTLTIEVPLYWDFTTALTAQVCKCGNSFLKLCGLEDMTFNVTSLTDNNQVIRLENAQNCWIKNVDISNSRQRAIQLDFSYRCEIRHCSITGGDLLGAGQGYGIALYSSSCANLIEDNILLELHIGMEYGYSSCGNVFAYNFETNGAADSGQAPGIGAHGYHVLMNLIEGNYLNDKILWDNTHGSGSHHTALRNRVVGFNQNGLTYDTTAIHLMAWNRFANMVGNILGKVGTHTSAKTWYPTSFNASTDKIVTRGGDDADLIRDVGDSQATSDPIIEGNWDSVSQSVTWTITPEAIPDSYYLASKPSNFGILSWPVYTSSVGNSAANTDIPAGYRYVNGNDPPASSVAQKRLGRYLKLKGLAN